MKTESEIKNKLRFIKANIREKPIDKMRNLDRAIFMHNDDIRLAWLEMLKWVLK